MKKLPYIIVGVLLIGAIIIVALQGDEKPMPQDIIPPINTQASDPTGEVLGKGSADTSDNTIKEEPPTSSNETPENETQQIPNATKATILTNKGEVVIELFPEAAPNTVKNFSEKSISEFYNGLTFHRIEDWVAQGGDPQGTGTGGSQMPTELNNNPFIRGSLGIARKNDIKISNDSQFFITKTDAPWLDKLYTNFGQVTEGMEVVDSLEIGDTITSITVE